MNFKKIRILLAFLAGSFLVVPTATFAGAESGFYIGAGSGNTSVRDGTFEASDTSFKIFGGYNIGFIPLIDLAIEASYVDFGSPSTSDGTIEVTGLNAFGLAGLSFGPFGVFVKAGAIDLDVDSNFSNSDSGTDSAYGVGARFAISSFAVRAEYEVYGLDNAIDMLSVSAVFTF